MTNESARIILLQMLDGLDPTTGEVLPPDHLLNDATVIRALHTAVLALTDISHPVRAPVNRNGRLNAGRAWTEMDRDALAVLSRSGASMETMCEKLQRRRRGVQRQLRDMGLPLPSTKKDARRAGTVWTEEDEEQLRKLYRLRRPVEEMARELERSTLAVYLRMERLELYGDEAGYPDGPVDRKRANARPCVTGQNPFLAETAKAFCRSGKMLQAVRPGKQKGGRSSLSNPEIRNNGQKSRC